MHAVMLVWHSIVTLEMSRGSLIWTLHQMTSLAPVTVAAIVEVVRM